MEITSFYSDILNLYTKLKFPQRYEELSKIDKYIAYYLADSEDQYVCSRQTNENRIIELDIKSAFPTICRKLFGLESDFVKKMDSITEKKGRLIYIATTLKEAGDYLTQLNIICKMVILGLLFELIADDNFLVYELKKDGLLMSCQPNSLEILQNSISAVNSPNSSIIDDEDNYPFTTFINRSLFNFHLTPFINYYRSNKTSIFTTESSEIIVKGKYKYVPTKLREQILKINCLEEYDRDHLIKVYSSTYFKICRDNGLTQVLNDYYIGDNDCVINMKGHYVKLNHKLELDPHMYLRLFVFPAILSTKIEG